MWLRAGGVKSVVKLREQHKHHPLTSNATRALEVFYWKSPSDTNVDFSWPSSLGERSYRARRRFIHDARLLGRRAPAWLHLLWMQSISKTINAEIKESVQQTPFSFFFFLRFCSSDCGWRIAHSSAEKFASVSYWLVLRFVVFTKKK